MSTDVKFMEVIVRNGEKSDMPAVLQLINELAEYENESSAVTISLEDLEREGFQDNPLFHVEVALMGEEIVGIVIYYYCFSTWKGRMLYIEDIVVKHKYRRMGIGKKLFDSVFSIAKEKNVKQIRFHVLDWNKLALGFYKKFYKVQIENNWLTCKIDKI